MKFETKLIHGGQSEDQATGAVSIPVYRFHQHSINMSWVVILSGNTVVQEILHVQP